LIVSSEWQSIVSGNAELKLSQATTGHASALRMDFDFKGGGGFVVARRALKRAMPEEYAVKFRLRGAGPANNLELKLVDSTGQNVWRHVVKDLRPPLRWKRTTVESGDIDFAWGPSSGGRLRELGSMEFAIVAGEGGKGTLWIADIEIVDETPTETPQLRASSAMPGFEPRAGLAGPGWKPRPDDPQPWIEIDSIQPRNVGGLVVDWLEHAPSKGFRIHGSNNGARWKTLRTAVRAGGKRSYVYLPGVKTRYLRLEVNEPTAGASVSLQSWEFSRSIHAFWHNVAAGEPRGWHPRWLHNEQSVWTPTGTADGVHCALLNADGMCEFDQGSPSLEPMLWIKGQLFTWADVTPRQELAEDWMPLPSVIWETPEWRLRSQAETMHGGVTRMRYRFENLGEEALDARLFVLVRPFQVTPPWQSFRNLGGVKQISELAFRDGTLSIDAATSIAPSAESWSVAPRRFAALRFDEGFMPSFLAQGILPPDSEVRDPFGFATGAFEFELPTGAHQFSDVALNCRPASAANPHVETPFNWRPIIPSQQWTGNDWAQEAIQAALTATAHILVTRSGPALQPGPRRYTRSWIRDGAMMSAALLRMGRTREVREFIEWYAPYQRSDGFVPCCVDHEGPDWLVEHDSHGQLIALIADHHRFAPDGALLEEIWEHVERAVECIERLLGEDGLLPVSVSHEGYLAQPVHSYWDDFWALRGLRDAVYLAQRCGRENLAGHWSLLATRFAASLFASIEATRAQRKLDFIPGSIEWADFDPTATANALYLFDVPDELNLQAVEQTFDKYLADWRGKRNGTVPALNYTPYEIRIIGALVRLGRRAAALELLRFFLSDRRPLAWNQWPEIAWRDRNAPAHVGDLPHTWIAAEYVLALRSLFAFERESDESLVIAAGLASEWLDGNGIRVAGMPTLYGNLSYTLRRMDAHTLQWTFDGGITAKMVLRPPLGAALRSVTVDGNSITTFDEDSATVSLAATEVIFSTM
jgi:F5/8 type C domain